METPPKLSFACPLPWRNMTGDECAKFCSQCGHSVHNLSLLDQQQRLSLLEQAKTERVCGAYYLRLTGEFVTPDKPLSPRERNTVKQFGVATLSAGALALAAGCTTTGQLATPSPTPAETTQTALEPEKDAPIVLFVGIIACPPPKPPHNGPPSKR